LLGGVNGDLRGGEAALAHPGDVEADGQAEGVDAPADGGGIDAGVKEGGQGHVAADAAEAVEMQSAHGASLRFQRDSIAPAAAHKGRWSEPSGARQSLVWPGLSLSEAPEAVPGLRSGSAPATLSGCKGFLFIYWGGRSSGRPGGGGR